MEWTASGAPRSLEFGDIYRDAADPLGESRHVFLDANRIARRLADRREDFVVAEAGFGSGINFLLTVEAWLDAGRPCRLHYLGFENRPLRREDLRRSLARFPELAEPANWLLAQYPPPASGCHRLHLHDRLQLDLFAGDTGEQISALGEGLRGRVQAWYLDGFSPGVNPEMWSAKLFSLMAQCCAPQATISTYSAAGAVRRGLVDSGFAMKRVKGFAGKRHMLRGVLRKIRPGKSGSPGFGMLFRCYSANLRRTLANAIARPPKIAGAYALYAPASPIRQRLLRTLSRFEDPAFDGGLPHRTLPGWSEESFAQDRDRKVPVWFRFPGSAAKGGTVAVIGAGIAGSGTASQLARRGWRVVVFERAEKLDRGVNSLGQLALHCRTFAQDSPLARFFLLGFLHSAREFARLARNRGLGWHPCGQTQLPRPRERRRKLSPEALAQLYPDEVLRWLSREQARDLTGLPIAGGAWHSPAAGWLDPLALCQCWLDHPGIELRCGARITSLELDGDGWRLPENRRATSDEPFAAVVIACGASARSFDALRELPLKQVPGEVISIPENSASSGIHHIIRGDRAIFPAMTGRHCIAASFPNAEAGKEAGESAGRSLSLIGKMFEPALGLASGEIRGTSAGRCQSSDFVPIIGGAPDTEECRRRFATLARNARAGIYRPPAHLPGLYLNLAHGSHGLCSAPLAADYLASLIHGETPPLARELGAALDPLRFLIRSLRRQGA